MVGICLKLDIARTPLRPDANILKFCKMSKLQKPDAAVVVLVVEILDAFKVERLDDSLEAEVKLGTATGRHH